MSGQQLKEIATAYRRRDDELFHRAFQRLIEDEEAKKHTALAADLRRLVGPGPRSRELPPLPTDKDSRLPLISMRTPARTLDSVILAPETRAVIDRLITEAEHGERLDELGLRRRNRALLYGPPGCGKTSVVEAIASELGRPLLIARTESLINSHLGGTASNLSTLFEFLNTGDYVLLIDEFDSVGQSRGTDDVGEMRRVVNSILQMIDLYTGPTIIVAATNHQEILDSALWRRFDTVAELPLPTDTQISGIIERLLPVKLKQATLETLVGKLLGMPHAAVEYFANGARRNALFDGRDDVRAEDVTVAIEETVIRRWA